jgi:endonuclease G
MRFSIKILPLIFFIFQIYAYGGDHLALGNPSGAKADIYSNTNYLIERDQYALSYDNRSGVPNWVSWHLNKDDLGDVARNKSFYTDTTLPDSWYRVTSNDYKNGGYDRGHMCPSADRTNTVDNNKATFIMTNIVPQSAANNQKAWAQFENYLRDLVKSGKEIYIISGPWGSIGSIKGEGRINIPATTWKIALILDNGENDLDRINENTTLITIEIPNESNLDSDWHKYITNVDTIEKLTGYNFFSNIDQHIQDVIESKKYSN